MEEVLPVTDSVFSVWPFRFHFIAAGEVRFPPGTAANTVRGAFGTIFRRLFCVPNCSQPSTCAHCDECPYARIFTPKTMSGPSGFGDLPRPFVFRAAHLDGQVIKPGAAFFFDLILFQPPESLLPFFTDTFRELARTGLGPGRGLAQLIAADSLASSSGGLTWNLADGNLDSDRVLLRFLTPTEIKSAGEITSTLDFPSLFCRLRDRISSLRACYQGGALDVDFRAIGQAAKNIDISWSHLHTVSAERRSSRTGQTHSLGGFAGEIEYTGHLAPFLPYLKAGEWTGVGRQTVWGKGHYLLEAAKGAGHPH